MNQVFLGDGVAESLAQANQQNLQNRKFDATEDDRLHRRLVAGVEGSDTPEKWATFMDGLGNEFGRDKTDPYRGFEYRAPLLDEVLNSPEMKRFRQTQANSDRSHNALQAHRATTNQNALTRIGLDRDKFEATTKSNALATAYNHSQDALKQKNNLSDLALSREKLDTANANNLSRLALDVRKQDFAERKPAKPSAMTEKISTLIASGLTEQQAQMVAAGRLTSSINPVTGERVLVDKGTQSIIPLSQPPQEGLIPRSIGAPAGEAVSPTTPQSQNPTLMQAAPDATGISSNVAAGVAQLPFGAGDLLLQNVPGAVDAVRAKQVFKVAENHLIRAFSLNPKFPVAEQKRILSLMPSTGVFSSSEDAKLRLQVLSNSLREAIKTNMNVVSSHAPVKDRQEAMASAQAMQQFIDTIGTTAGAQPQKTRSGVSFKVLD